MAEKLTNFEMVKQFHKAFCPDQISAEDSYELFALRMRLIQEEFDEVVNAWEVEDKAELAKELADLLYVTYGAAVAYGIDIDKVFEEVHRSNMTKLLVNGKPLVREDGKILKGENYEPAVIREEWLHL